MTGAADHGGVIFRCAAASRLLLLSLIVLWRTLVSPYDTSASINPSCLSSPTSDSILYPSIAAAIESSVVWDAVYFVRISQCGYEYEQSYAFLPLLPISISLLSRTGRILCASLLLLVFVAVKMLRDFNILGVFFNFFFKYIFLIFFNF